VKIEKDGRNKCDLSGPFALDVLGKTDGKRKRHLFFLGTEKREMGVLPLPPAEKKVNNLRRDESTRVGILSSMRHSEGLKGATPFYKERIDILPFLAMGPCKSGYVDGVMGFIFKGKKNGEKVGRLLERTPVGTFVSKGKLGMSSD